MCAADSESGVEFWRLKTVCAVSGLSKTEIYRRVGQGRFPPPRKYPGTGKSFWLSTEVRAWQTDLLACMEAAAARPAI